VQRLPGPVAYRLVCTRLAGLLRARQPAATAAVPACPEWTVEDVLAHVTGIAVRALAAETGESAPGVTRGPGLTALLAQWEEVAGRLDRLLAGRDGMEQMLMDAVTHEYDLRVALGEGPPPDDPAVPVALDFLGPAFSWTVVSRGLPPLRVDCGDRAWLAGADEPAVVVRGEAAELMRSLTGRRTLAQITALDWSRDPRPWLPAFAWGPFRPPSRPVE
jgi:uncharacterized protein (TIGR03083 family)